MTGSMIIDLFIFIILFSSVLFLAWVTTKFIASKQKVLMKGKTLELIEVLALGMDKRLYLVRAGSSYMIFSSSGKRFEFACELKDEDGIIAGMIDNIGDTPASANSVQRFRDILVKNLKSMIEAGKAGSNSERKEILRTNIEKLRNLTSGQKLNNTPDRDDTNEKNRKAGKA